MGRGAQTFHTRVLQPFYKGKRAGEQSSSWSLATLADSAAAGCLQHPQHPREPCVSWGSHTSLPTPQLPCKEGTSLSSGCLPHQGTREAPDGVPTAPSLSCRAPHGHRGGQSRAGALAPEIPQGWHRSGAGGTLYPGPAAAGRVQRKNGEKEEEKRKMDPPNLPLRLALQSCFTGTQPWSSIPAKLMYKKPVSL